jgi:hypothetical protein
MSSTYSSSLRIELIGSGDQAGAWGTTTNGNLEYILDTAIAGYQAVTVTSTNQALTYVNGSSSTASLNESIYAMLKFNSAAAASAIYAPPASKQYIIWNNSGYTITIYNSTVIGNTTAAGTGVAIANGDKVMVWSDATNFYDVKGSGITGTLAIANGGTGQTTQQTAINALVGAQTNNRVLRSDGTNSTLSQVALATDVTGTYPLPTAEQESQQRRQLRHLLVTCSSQLALSTQTQQTQPTPAHCLGLVHGQLLVRVVLRLVLTLVMHCLTLLKRLVVVRMQLL